MFNKDGNITGWDEIRDFKIEVKNTRDVQVKVEIQRNFDCPHWNLKKEGEFGKYEKIDRDTVRFSMSLPKRSQKEFRYVLTTRHGTRE